MKKLIFLLFISISLNTFSQEIEFNYAKSVNEFTFSFFESVNKNDKNIIFSPYSISAALTMTYCGAEAQTQRAMAQTLFLTEDRNQVADIYAQYNRSINAPIITDNITLKNANSLWGEKSYPFKREYIELVEAKFGAPLTKLSFINEPKECTETINKWVEKKTENKIKDLIPEGVISGNTRMVLVNAVYFYGGWAKAFEKQASAKQNFYLNETDTIELDFMNTYSKLYYFENELFKAVEIPYKGKAASMILFIPKNIAGIENLAKTLDFKTYESWNAQMVESNVMLSVPKFKVESDFELSDVLSNLGMKIAFTNNANFTAMSEKDDLKIDKVFHKATIEIDEEGTEASAATAVVMVRKTAVFKPLNNVEFKADRPFLFVVKENQNNSILFMGKVLKPQ